MLFAELTTPQEWFQDGLQVLVCEAPSAHWHITTHLKSLGCSQALVLSGLSHFPGHCQSKFSGMVSFFPPKSYFQALFFLAPRGASLKAEDVGMERTVSPDFKQSTIIVKNPQYL